MSEFKNLDVGTGEDYLDDFLSSNGGTGEVDNLDLRSETSDDAGRLVLNLSDISVGMHGNNRREMGRETNRDREKIGIGGDRRRSC